MLSVSETASAIESRESRSSYHVVVALPVAGGRDAEARRRGKGSRVCDLLPGGVAAPLLVETAKRGKGKSPRPAPALREPDGASGGSGWMALLRLIMDQRWGNAFFYPPRKVQVSSAESVGSIDASLDRLVSDMHSTAAIYSVQQRQIAKELDGLLG